MKTTQALLRHCGGCVSIWRICTYLRGNGKPGGVSTVCPELENRNTNLVWRVVGACDWPRKAAVPKQVVRILWQSTRKSREGSIKPREAKHGRGVGGAPGLDCIKKVRRTLRVKKATMHVRLGCVNQRRESQRGERRSIKVLSECV